MCCFLSSQPPAAESGEIEAEGARKEEEEEEEDAIPCTPVPQEWVCQGSDAEIREGMFQEGRPRVSGGGQSKCIAV